MPRILLSHYNFFIFFKLYVHKVWLVVKSCGRGTRNYNAIENHVAEKILELIRSPIKALRQIHAYRSQTALAHQFAPDSFIRQPKKNTINMSKKLCVSCGPLIIVFLCWYQQTIKFIPGKLSAVHRICSEYISQNTNW